MRSRYNHSCQRKLPVKAIKQVKLHSDKGGGKNMRDLYNHTGLAGRYSTWHTFVDTLAILLGIIALGVIVAIATLQILA